MVTAIHPKLPMRNKTATKDYYIGKLGFTDVSAADYDGYLILEKDGLQLHFFMYSDLNPDDNYGQVYIHTDNINGLYDEVQQNGAAIHPNGPLMPKPWGMMEFSMLDPDKNLLTVGQRC